MLQKKFHHDTKMCNNTQEFGLESGRHVANITPNGTLLLVRIWSYRALIGREPVTWYPVGFLTPCCMLVMMYI